MIKSVFIGAYFPQKTLTGSWKSIFMVTVLFLGYNGRAEKQQGIHLQNPIELE